MPPSGVDYASEFLNGYAPEYVDFYKDSVLSIIDAIQIRIQGSDFILGYYPSNCSKA
jgi:hypothetical protein